MSDPRASQIRRRLADIEAEQRSLTEQLVSLERGLPAASETQPAQSGWPNTSAGYIAIT